MDKNLILKAQELRRNGLSYTKIAIELLITKSKAKYLCSLDIKEIEKKKSCNDIFEKKICQLVKKCDNIYQICKILGYKPTNTYYYKINKIIEKYNLDTSHFKKNNINNTIKKELPIEKCLIEHSTLSSCKIKDKLLKHSLKEYKCERCGRTEWEGKPIPLELHHINGDNTDNRIENLQILCPNCHAFTDNYRGRRKRKQTKKLEKKEEKEILSKEQLIEDFKEYGTFSSLAKKYNINTKTVRTLFEKHNLPSSSIELRNYLKKIYPGLSWKFSEGNPDAFKKEAIKKRKKVGQYNKNNELIKTYESIAQTEQDGFNSTHVGNCCNGKLKTHKGFIWKFL